MDSEKADQDLPPTVIPKAPRPQRRNSFVHHRGMTTITKDIQSIAAETDDFKAAAVRYFKNVIRACEQALAEIEGEEPHDGEPGGK